MSINHVCKLFLYLVFQMKFENRVTNSSYRAEKYNMKKYSVCSTPTNTKLSIFRHGWCSEHKITSYLKRKKDDQCIPHFEPDRFSKFSPNPAHKSRTDFFWFSEIISVGYRRSDVFGNGRFWFCPNLITFSQISPQFCPTFAQIQPNLPS